MGAAATTTEGTAAAPTVPAGPQPSGLHPGRHAYTAQQAWTELLTVVHVSWLERRNRNPLIWTIPIALAVAILAGH